MQLLSATKILMGKSKVTMEIAITDKLYSTEYNCSEKQYGISGKCYVIAPA